jgi:hypothetical protein
MNRTATDTESDVVAEITAGHGRDLGQATRLFPPYRKNRPVNTSTVFRWITEGVKLPDGTHLKLEAARVGGRYRTSAQAIERFIRRQNEPPPEQPRPRTAKQRTMAAERADKELARIGI